MKTTEERMKLISQRTDELKKEIKIKENLKKRRTVSAGCMAACIMIVVCAGALMPSLIKTAENGDVTYRYGAASIISEAPAAGYVIMGLMSFALGVCLTLVIFRLRSAEKKRMSDRMGHSDDKSKNKSDDDGDRDAAAGRRR